MISINILSLKVLDSKQMYNKFGMPSSHAQFMGFMAAYAVFFAYIRYDFFNSPLFVISPYMQ